MFKQAIKSTARKISTKGTTVRRPVKKRVSYK